MKVPSEESFYRKSVNKWIMRNILFVIIIASMLFGSVVWADEDNKESQPKDLKSISYPEGMRID